VIKKMKIFLIFFLLIPLKMFAQSNEHLKEIIAERRELYTTWKEQLDQKSGIFGSQTKGDVQEINDVLKQIIKKDNIILEEVESSQNAEYQKLLEKYNILIAENDQLLSDKKKLNQNIETEKNYQKDNHKQIARIEGDRILLGLLILLFGGLILWLILKLLSTKRNLRSLELLIKNSK
jgi:hypothetical protein